MGRICELIKASVNVSKKIKAQIVAHKPRCGEDLVLFGDASFSDVPTMAQMLDEAKVCQ